MVFAVDETTPVNVSINPGNKKSTGVSSKPANMNSLHQKHIARFGVR